MAFVLIGLALLAMKVAALGPVADWSWFVVLAPFGLAVAWWAFADSTGLTQRRAIDKMEQRKAERRQRDMDALGLTPKRDKQVRRARADAGRAPAPPARAPGAEPAETAQRRDPEL